MKTVRETEVLIIGGGIIGCTIAYFLARRGSSATVIDAVGIGEGTSKATLALVWVQNKEPATYMELNLLGTQLHAELASGFDEDVELRQPGGLNLYHDETHLESRLEIMERLNAGSNKYQARAVSVQEARTFEPFASKDIAGGIYGPHDGHINPFKYIAAVVRVSKSRGVDFLLHTPVLQILRDENGISGVETTEGVIRAKQVVVAAGMSSAELVRPLGLEIPLKFRRGQIIVTARAKRTIFHPMGDQRQTEAGNILIGSTSEDVGLDRSTTFEAARQIAHRVIRLFPVLSDMLVIRQYSGIRPIPFDGLPILGAVQSIPGLYTSVSHSGITLAPVHGKAISELIMDGETEVPIDLYRPERFEDVAQPDPLKK